jgi:hypothetical protein
MVAHIITHIQILELAIFTQLNKHVFVERIKVLLELNFVHGAVEVVGWVAVNV